MNKNARSDYYKEKSNRIASDVRKLCRLYETTYSDVMSNGLLENSHKYNVPEDSLISSTFEYLLDKFMISGRWTDREMLKTMWRDFQKLHIQSCDDKRCSLEKQGRIDTGYTASHGMLQLLMCLADAPTQAGKVIYISDDFLNLENLSLLIPKRKEYIDTTEFSIMNESFTDWTLDYEYNKREFSDNEDDEDEEESEATTHKTTDVPATSVITSVVVDAKPLIMQEGDYSVYFTFGADIGSYQPETTTISYHIDGSANPYKEIVIQQASTQAPDLFFCTEADMVKLVLEMLMGSENELFLLPDTSMMTTTSPSLNSRFALSHLAHRLRLVTESLTPTMIQSILTWCSDVGSKVQYCRQHVAIYMKQTKTLYADVYDSLVATMIEQLDHFQQALCEMEGILFADSYERLSIIDVHHRLKPWCKVFSSMESVFSRRDASSVQLQMSSLLPSQESQLKFIDNCIMEELHTTLVLLSYQRVPENFEVHSTLPFSQTSDNSDNSGPPNLVLSLPLLTNDSMYTFYSETFFSSVDAYLNRFMHEVWSGSLHKKIKDRMLGQTDRMLGQTDTSTRMSIAKSTSASVLSSTDTLRYRDVQIRDGHAAAVIEAPAFLRSMATQAILAGTDLALVNKFSHLSSVEHHSSTRSLYAASSKIIESLRISVTRVTENPTTHHNTTSVIESRLNHTTNYSLRAPVYPSSCFSNIDILFDNSGTNAYDKVLSERNTPSTHTTTTPSVSQSLSAAKEFTLLDSCTTIVLVTPLVSALQDIQQTAVQVMYTSFRLTEHFQFCLSTFLLQDTRLYDMLRSKCLPTLSIEMETIYEETSYESSLGHVLAYLLNQQLPSESTSSVTVEIHDESHGKSILKRYIQPSSESTTTQFHNNGILSTIASMNIHLLLTWPLSEIFTVHILNEYNKIHKFLLSLTTAKWATDSIWKLAAETTPLFQPCKGKSIVNIRTKRLLAMASSYRYCLIGLYWFQYILSGLQSYYLRRIHDEVWPNLLTSCVTCTSIIELSSCHDKYIHEISMLVNAHHTHISMVMNLGHRATCAFHRALNMLNSPLLDIDEVALGIASSSTKPLVELFFERTEADYRTLRTSVKNLSATLDTMHAQAKTGRTKSLDSGLRNIFSDTRNWN